MAGGVRRDDDEIISDINVTPFVDVALVLLVIFMVTATYIVAQAIPVDLPNAGTGEEVVTTFAITLTSDGFVHLDGEKTDELKIRAKLNKAKKESQDIRVVIAADQKVEHGRVVRIIDLIRKVGVTKFAISIDSED